MGIKRNKAAAGAIPKQKNFNKRKFLAIIFIAIAAAIAFVLLPFLYNSKADTATVYIANKDIPKGTVLDKSYLTTKEIGVYGLSSYITDASDVIGEVTAIDVAKGDIITQNKLGGSIGVTPQSLTREGKKLMSVTAKSNAAGLVTHLAAGDVVNVWRFAENDWGELTPVLDEQLKNLVVYCVENSDGKDATLANTDALMSEDNLVSTITLILNNDVQAGLLLQAESGKGIHIELVERE